MLSVVQPGVELKGLKFAVYLVKKIKSKYEDFKRVLILTSQ